MNETQSERDAYNAQMTAEAYERINAETTRQEAAERTIDQVIAEIRTVKAQMRDGELQIASAYQMSDLAVELADLSEGLLKMVRGALTNLDEQLASTGVLTEADETCEPVKRGSVTGTILQFVAVITERDGTWVTDERTAAEAVSFVFNLDMLTVRENLTRLSRTDATWGIPLSETGWDALRQVDRGRTFRATDQFTGYTIAITRA